MTAVPANLREDWAAFAAAVEARLATGAAAYADRSLDADPSALSTEIEAELADAAGWSFLLWRRLRALRGLLPADCPEIPGATVAVMRSTRGRR